MYKINNRFTICVPLVLRLALCSSVEQAGIEEKVPRDVEGKYAGPPKYCDPRAI